MIHTLTQRSIRFLKNEDGVTSVECALLLGLVVAICLVALAPASAQSDAAPEPTIVLETESN